MAKGLRKRANQPTTATERMEAARTAKQSAITREICWVSIASRLWPSYTMLPRVPQRDYPLMVVLETPGGILMYRVRSDELPLFEHLERRPNTGEPHQDKIAILHALASEGW